MRRQIAVKPESIQRVVKGLYDVVHSSEGTGAAHADPALDVAGKTGTAQTGYHAKDESDPKVAWSRTRDHAWFASFAPSNAPDIAVVVLIEHGESGPKAAPVAYEMVREFNRLRALRASGGASAAKKRAGDADRQ